jgi:hypothetical protein
VYSSLESEGERRVAHYPQFDEDRKSKNVDDLLRYLNTTTTLS